MKRQTAKFANALARYAAQGIEIIEKHEGTDSYDRTECVNDLYNVLEHLGSAARTVVDVRKSDVEAMGSSNGVGAAVKRQRLAVKMLVRSILAVRGASTAISKAEQESIIRAHDEGMSSEDIATAIMEHRAALKADAPKTEKPAKAKRERKSRKS